MINIVLLSVNSFQPNGVKRINKATWSLLTIRLDASPPTQPVSEFSWQHPAMRTFACSNKGGCSGVTESKIRVQPDGGRDEILTKSVSANLH